jgi:hypothetical protein
MTPGLGRDPCERDEADAARDRQVIIQEVEESDPAMSAKGRLAIRMATSARLWK